ncbi:MAG: DUF4194 domain-containing protein [Pseudomonadales bacterium]
MSNIFDTLTESATVIDENNAAPVDQVLNKEPNEEAVIADASASVQYTPRQIKNASQELLKYGLLEMSAKPNLYRTALGWQSQLNDILEPLDLLLRIDDVRGLAYLVVAESVDNDDSSEDAWSHPLVRRQRLNLEQSLLVAMLREHYVAHELESGIGSSGAVIDLDELLPRMQVYLGEMGSEMAEQNRLRHLLEKLKGHGIVSEVNKHDQVTIRPVITHVANPENLQNLIVALKQRAVTENRENQENQQ